MLRDTYSSHSRTRQTLLSTIIDSKTLHGFLDCFKPWFDLFDVVYTNMVREIGVATWLHHFGAPSRTLPTTLSTTTGWEEKVSKMLYRMGNSSGDWYFSFCFFLGGWRASNIVAKEQIPGHWSANVRGMKTFHKKAAAGRVLYSVNQWK